MARAGRRVLVLVTVTVSGAGLSGVAGSGAAQAAPAMGRAGSAGNVPVIAGQLFGVSADSATDAWAVGQSSSGGLHPRRTLIVHWNGTAWSQVPSPSPGSGPNGAALTGVSAVSPSDAWAVGFFSNSANLGQTLILHWNGTAWSRVPSPNPSARGAGFDSVSAVSPTDAWAVGTFTTSALVSKPLIVHWNGIAWSQVPSPDPGLGVNTIAGVSAVSATSAWTVGTYGVKPRILKSMTLRWDGTAWSHVKTPDPPGDSVQLNGVSALSGTDAWAVGNSYTGANLVLHWNGTAWSQASVPNPPARMGRQLTGVSAVSATDAWAVGWGRHGTRMEPFFTVALHWNGTAWSRVPSPNVNGSSEFFAVDAVSPTDAWAVGFDGSILIEHWNGTAWSAG